jgi:hypothetical protein
MIIKIDALHKELLQKTCAELGFTAEVFTMEANQNLLMVEILWGTGRDLSSEVSFSLGKCFGEEVAASWVKEAVKPAA